MSQKLVLILNCGSSSLKFSILDPQTGEEKLSGLAEAFHLDDARIKWKLHGEKGNADLGAGAAHSKALNFIVNSIFPLDPSLKEDIVAIGHRIVHGGENSRLLLSLRMKWFKALKTLFNSPHYTTQHI